MDDELVLGRIDIWQAGMGDGEEKAVGRDCALQQMVRRARMRIAELVVGITACANHILLKP